MAYKIYIEGNSLIMEDNGNTPTIVYEGNAKDCLLTRVYDNSTDFSFRNLNRWDSSDLIEFTDVDLVGADYTDLTTFISWCRDNLGKSSPQASGQILVNQGNVATTLGGVIDSSKEYFIDGIIDMDTISITVPVNGLTLRGYSFDISGLTSSRDDHTLFVSESEVIGSGGLLAFDLFIEETGLNSKVFNLYDATGNNALEFTRVNYNNCTSLGDLHNYRQGLEVGTGRFGGSPSLTLHGAWAGGYRATTSIVRGMSNTTTEPLFKKGIGFVMQSRFLTDINCDLGTLQPLFDFDSANFPNPSSLEIKNAIITRNGLSVPNDTNITSNIQASNLSCSWKSNNGIPNTFIGGISTCSVEVETLLTQNLPFILLGTFDTNDLQHFDSPANGQLRHLGDNPREYTVNFDFSLDGGANQTYSIQLVKNDGSLSVVYQQQRVVNNLQGGGNTRDIAYFSGLANVILNKNEVVYWQVVNLTNNSNCTLESGSSWSVEER